MKIAIISGKGGTGKSSISSALIAQAQNVIAVDCDVDASNLPIIFKNEVEKSEPFVSGTTLKIDPSLCTLCGRCYNKCAFHALHAENGKMSVNNVLCEGCGLCIHICPTHAITLTKEAKSNIYENKFNNGKLIYGHLFPGDDNSGKMISRLREIADDEMKKNNIKLQILDGPPGIGCPVMSTITGVDKLIIVTEPTKSGLSDLKRIYQASISFCLNIYIIINKCDINNFGYKAIKHFCMCMRLPIIAELPFDKKIVEAQVNNESIMTYSPESICAIQLKKVYNEIIKL